MTQEEILEYNRLCAEFLGLTIYKALKHYHSDWNSIMEVVEAIEKLDNIYVQIEENACYIYDISKFDDIQTNSFIMSDRNMKSKKEAVVEAINQFLIWYKKQTL